VFVSGRALMGEAGGVAAGADVAVGAGLAVPSGVAVAARLGIGWLAGSLQAPSRARRMAATSEPRLVVTVVSMLGQPPWVW
jgi:hypothetical protein